MSEAQRALRRKLDSAQKLGGVVRIMKAIAASNLGQCERAVEALAEYRATVELGLSAGLRDRAGQPGAPVVRSGVSRPVGAVVFGSDQGLVGRFNEALGHHVCEMLAGAQTPPLVWVVGERMRDVLAAAGVVVAATHATPSGMSGIVPLVSALLETIEAVRSADTVREVYLFFQRSGNGSDCEPAHQRLLPLDRSWRDELARRPWPSRNVPEIIGTPPTTLRALVGEFLLVSLYSAGANSLAAENVTRLRAMQRAEQNIDELLERLTSALNHERQDAIDAELFDLAAGFQVLADGSRRVTDRD